MRRFTAIAFAFLLIAGPLPAAQPDKVVKKIIEIGTTDNRTMQHEDFLANRIGGRIVGSHELEDAEKWVADQMRSWGLEVRVQEVGEIQVGFSRGPWYGRNLTDGGTPLHFGTPAYTAGTKGPTRGHVVIAPKSEREFERMKGTAKGAWVLLDSPSRGLALSLRDSTMISLLMDAGALGFIQGGELPLQILYDRAHCFDLTMDTLPTVCDIKLEKAQFDDIYRRVQARERVELEFDIRNHFFAGPVKFHNILGILRGSKYPDEYVISGGHLDAYDGGSGAIDDGQGTSVTLESARLLAAAGAKPRRSIIFSIWTAEEYGLLGSKYFVENKTVPLEKISNYFNRDGGPEVAVSVTVPPAMYDDFVQICEPLADVNPDFPFEVIRRTAAPGPRPTSAGGSDHAYFAMNGVPTVSLGLRDVKGYGFNYRDIWHTDRDLYDKCIPEYMEHSALVNAVVLYGVANLDHLLSREGLYTD
jgi:hypothetical protein